jgi:hypothetical protein
MACKQCMIVGKIAILAAQSNQMRDVLSVPMEKFVKESLNSDQLVRARWHP